MLDSDTARKIHKSKYSNGKETWEQTCFRVANHVASVEEKFGKTQKEIDEITGEYFDIIYNLVALPGGRIIANAGTGIKNLMNCFSLGIEDSRKGIYGTLGKAAEIFAMGGGCGYNFSKIREEGALINSTKGSASGPISFMSLFDQTGEVIQQASRRGAQIGLLNIYHPDIIKFIRYKSEPNSRNERLLEEYHNNLTKCSERLKNTKYYDVLRKTLLDDQLTHFNISIVINDDFMERVENGSGWDFISIKTGEVTDSINARELLKIIANNIWESGDPGILFYDRVNQDNLVPYLGEIEICNPCGEVPMLAWESCCLGSINLLKFYNKATKTLDFNYLERVVRIFTRFLNGVQEVSETPVDEINYYSKGLLRLGLGVMGWHDLLAEMEIPYDSQTAFDLAEYLAWFISFFSLLESADLGEERGEFPLCEREKLDLTVFNKILHSKFVPPEYKFNINEMKFRNVSVTTIPPTGSISLLAGVNSSIEPFFALAYKRNITEGVGNIAKDYIIEINPILFRKLKEHGVEEEDIEKIKEYVIEKGTVKGCDLVPEKLQEVFKISQEINWKSHIDMQASWQKYITNSISKTINCNKDTTPEEIYEMLIYMWQRDLKGGTIYRDQSKSFQILNIGIQDKKEIKDQSNKCPICGGNLIRSGGCKKCENKDCEYSLCEL